MELTIDETRRLATIRDCSAVPEGLRIRLVGIDDRDSATALTGAAVRVSRENLSHLKEGEFFDADLLGLEVITSEGRTLGTLTEVVETGANDVYVVAGEGGEILVPAVAHAIVAIDFEARRVTVVAEALEYPDAPKPPRELGKTPVPRNR